MNFLGIPLKRSYDVDLFNPIQSYISTKYGFSGGGSQNNYDQAIRDFASLRSRAVVQLNEKNEKALDIVSSYYDQLVSIENKLPLTPTDIPISFRWKDAFKSSLFDRQSLTLPYGTYERACVLFNVAALQSHVAAAQPMNTDDQLKTASKLYQQSAGNLNEISAHVEQWLPEQTSSSADFTGDMLQALAAIMLAQGQEAIYLKAHRDNMKAALLVKVAAQAAHLYDSSFRMMNSPATKPLWDRDWLSTVQGKQLFFDALANSHKAVECAANKDISEQLSRLKHALDCLNKAKSLLGSSANSDMFRSEFNRIQGVFDAADKENKFIYNELVADYKGLEELPRAALAKPLPPSHPISANFKDVFADVVPTCVATALAACDVRRKTMISVNVDRLKEQTDMLNATLAALNLPAAIEDTRGKDNLPESLREKSAKVRAAGGITSLADRIATLPALLRRNTDVIDETERLLKEEETMDKNLRAQYKKKWTRMESKKMTKPLWTELEKYKDLVKKAQNADKIVTDKFAQHKQYIEMLSKTESDLRLCVPRLGADAAAGNASGNVCAALDELDSLMTRVKELKDSREELKRQFEQRPFDLKPELLRALAQKSSGSPSEDTSAINLGEGEIAEAKLQQVFGDLRLKVDETCAAQEKLLQQIQNAHTRFESANNSPQSSDARDTVLRSLAAAFDAFQTLQANVDEGTKFYTEMTPLLVALQQRVSAMCFSRKTEKEELLKGLDKGKK